MLCEENVCANCNRATLPADTHTVWISSEEKIASFHDVPGYKVLSFFYHEEFINFLCSLQEQGYRFQ